MSYKLVIAEKPSVAQSIAKVIGADKREDGYMEGNGYIVSWCVGHLVELASPESYDEKYEKWRYDDLPILPSQWNYQIAAATRKQFSILKKLMEREDVTGLVEATDAGREGELIFRLVYNQAKCKKPFERLWISSMEDQAISDGFSNLKNGREYDDLYQAALCRERADWIVGMNATRLFSTYDGNVSIINNYIIPTIGNNKLNQINNHFIEKYYQELLDMPAVKSTRNMDESGKITAATVKEIHKILRSCFRQAVKWGIMEKNPATDATVPKHKKEEREIWTAEMLMQAIEACENRWLKIAFHLCFTATLRLGELLGLTWDCVEISQKAIDSNSAYIIINKEVERISKKAVEVLKQKDIIQVFPSMRKNNRTVRVLKTPKTESSIRKVYIPSSVALLLAEFREEQNETIEALGDMYENYNLVMATSYGLAKGVTV